MLVTSSFVPKGFLVAIKGYLLFPYNLMDEHITRATTSPISINPILIAS